MLQPLFTQPAYLETEHAEERCESDGDVGESRDEDGAKKIDGRTDVAAAHAGEVPFLAPRAACIAH